jgi:hypothetical protein
MFLLFLAAGGWFIYLAICLFRGEQIGAFGWIVGRPFKQEIGGWSTRLASIALSIVGVWMTYYGFSIM